MSRIHHVKYDYKEDETKFHVWQYSNIGPGKKIDVPVEPKAPRFEEKVKFMRVETNLVLYLKEERILIHQMIFPVQKKHVCLCLIICKIVASSQFWMSSIQREK